MANKSILNIIKTVAKLVGVSEPTTATGSTDIQVKQLLALANEEGQELAARFDWTALVREATYTALGVEDQGAINGTILNTTVGFDKMLNDTIWNRTTMFGPGGPLSPQSWQALQATVSTSPWSQYRIRQGHLYLKPAPTAGDTLAFEYKTENWVSNAAGDEARTEFTMDDDYPILDSRLIERGLVWRWKQAKGLGYAEDMQKYENAVLDKMTGDGTHARANMAGRTDDYEPFVMVPRGNWNLP